MRNALIAIVAAAAFMLQTASALKYNVRLSEPGEFAKAGISASVRETKSGDLKCSLTFDSEQIKVASIELRASIEGANISVPVQVHDKGEAKTCHFTLSPELMMHGELEIAVADNTPGGFFYDIALVDMIDFGRDLPPALERRRALRIDLLVQKRIARYEDSTPARDADGNLAEFLRGRTPITPYKSESN
ncbi:MAG: hypothetical protein AAF514_07605 [Verrucomicrobiota bacterium]